MPGPIIHGDLDSAVEAIQSLVSSVAHPGRHPVIGITGPPGSGKSHLAGLLSTCILTSDDYLPDYDRTPEHLRDLPEASDLDRLRRDLESLRSGRPTRVPCWCFFEHRRVREREVTPAPPIACEGLHALHERVRSAIDVLVFVQAAAEVRWSRVEARERAGQRGWPIEYARHFFHNVAEPTYATRAEDYRRAAHVVVLNEGARDLRP